jgi:hypothetical protein
LMAFMTIVEPSLMVRTNIRETNPKDQEKDSWEVLAMKIRGRGQLKCDALGICSLLNHKIISIPSTACWTQFSHRPIKKKTTDQHRTMNWWIQWARPLALKVIQVRGWTGNVHLPQHQLDSISHFIQIKIKAHQIKWYQPHNLQSNKVFLTFPHLEDHPGQ